MIKYIFGLNKIAYPALPYPFSSLAMLLACLYVLFFATLVFTAYMQLVNETGEDEKISFRTVFVRTKILSAKWFPKNLFKLLNIFFIAFILHLLNHLY